MPFAQKHVVLDSPVNNFATWNTLSKLISTGGQVHLSLSDGQLKSNSINSEGSDYNTAITTIAIPTIGK